MLIGLKSVKRVNFKSGKLTVSTYASYIEQGLPHTKKDKKVGWKEVMLSKEEVLSHTRVLSHVFRVGETHGEKNQNRVKKALHEDITVVPNLTILQKDHKPVDPETGLPATRPVCEASVTFNQRANQHLCTILQGVTRSDPTCEKISTEDMISRIDHLNKEIEEGKIEPKNMIVGSLDVQALY